MITVTSSSSSSSVKSPHTKHCPLNRVCSTVRAHTNIIDPRVMCPNQVPRKIPDLHEISAVPVFELRCCGGDATRPRPSTSSWMRSSFMSLYKTNIFSKPNYKTPFLYGPDFMQTSRRFPELFRRGSFVRTQMWLCTLSGTLAL